jgi:hypothetical protein
VSPIRYRESRDSNGYSAENILLNGTPNVILLIPSGLINEIETGKAK